MPLTFRQFLKEQQDAAEQRVDPKTFNLKNLFRELNLQMRTELPDYLPVTFGKPPKRASGVTSAMINRETKRIDTSTIKIVIRDMSWPLQRLRGCLAHEMVHAALFFDNINDGHGFRFMARLRELESRAGFKIPLDDKIDDEQHAEMIKKRVAFIFGQDPLGKYVIGLFTPNLTPDDLQKGAAAVDFLTIKRRFKFVMFGYALTPLANRFTVGRKIDVQKNAFYALPPEQVKWVNPQQLITHTGQLPTF